MPALLLGLLLVVAVIAILRWFAHADVKTARKAVNWGGLTLIGLVIVFLAVTGRMAGAIAGVMALAAWGWRILSMLHMGRQFSAMFRSFKFGTGGGGSAEQASEVDSAFLRMRLDLASGVMEGEVKQGRFAGRKLNTLSQSDLMSLLEDVGSDQDSIGLLEAYLDRVHPDWREGAGAQTAGQTTPQSAMTSDEAYRVLGLKAGASDAEIKAAYRRLMGQLHPDHGGSDYLAAKVNQAKDFLLKR